MHLDLIMYQRSLRWSLGFFMVLVEVVLVRLLILVRGLSCITPVSNQELGTWNRGFGNLPRVVMNTSIFLTLGSVG